jgi:imidazolonepropionase-like amidohydrolase
LKTTGLIAAAAAAILFASLGVARADPPTGVLVENVRIFDGVSARLSAPSNVLVVGNVIQAISAAPVTPPVGVTVTKIAGGGRTLMPGLIDNHVHVFMAGTSQAEMLAPDASAQSLEAKAAAEAERMLLRGFTAVRDMGGPVFGLKRSIDAGTIPGPRIYPSGAMVSQTSGHGDTRLPSERSRRFFGQPSKGELLGVNFIADGRDEVLTATRENLRFGASQIKIMAGGGAATVYDPLDVTQYTLDEMKAAVDAAEDWGTYVTVHSYTPRAVRRAIEAGARCVEHGQLLDEPTMKLLAEKRVFLSLQALDEAPASAAADVRAKKHTVIEGTDTAFRWAKTYGVQLAWGTDQMFDPAASARQGADILKLRQWLTPAEILKLVTHDNAQLLALSGPRNPYPGRLGVVQEGALADLLLVDGDPLANLDLIADAARSFVVIMKDGQVQRNVLR